MTIQIKEKDGQTTVSLKGMLDSSSTPSFQEATAKLLDEGKINIKIDLSELEYTSSMGLRAILTLIKNIAAKGGKLIFSQVKPAVLEIFDLSGISQAMIFE